MEQNQKIVINAKNAVLGRLASFAAKQALLGKEIAIVNCGEAVVTGRTSSVLDDYKEARQRGGASQKGPFFPRSPERIVKRTIRGMLSHRQGRGRDAFKRIRCFDGVPEEYRDSKMVLAGREKKMRITSLKQISETL